ncbi:MAG: alpha/beta hydrolase [Solirubrobacteraceae bacterium]|nr:MAG: esterase [Solirubrobacterales bacterium]
MIAIPKPRRRDSNRRVGVHFALLALVALIACGVLAVGSASAFSAARGKAKARSAQVAGVPQATGVVVEVLHLRVPGTTTTRAVRVYRPNVADSAAIPILYFLHGHPGHPGDLDTANLSGTMTRWLRAGARPFVVVVPDGNGTRHSDTEWANAADGSDQEETFVTHTILSAVEGANIRAPRDRAIGGFSMGGYGAMNIALRNPTLYGQIVSMAGYFHVDDLSSVFANKRALIAANSPDRHALQARGKSVLLMDAETETDPLIQGEAARMARVLRGAGVKATVRLGTGGHDLSYVRAALPSAFEFLESAWR